MKADNNAVEYGQNAYNKFKQKYPCNPTTDHGYLFWDDTELTITKDGHQNSRTRFGMRRQ
jgi:hypothetical protein